MEKKLTRVDVLLQRIAEKKRKKEEKAQKDMPVPLPPSDISDSEGDDVLEGAPEDVPEEEEGLFPVAKREEVLPMRPDDGIPAVDSDLTEDEKKEFIKLLNREIPLSERASQLALLARMKGSKTAAVGLRAIQEINRITGLTGDRPTESAPLFVLPEGTKVGIVVQTVVK